MHETMCNKKCSAVSCDDANCNGKLAFLLLDRNDEMNVKLLGSVIF